MTRACRLSFVLLTATALTGSPAFADPAADAEIAELKTQLQLLSERLATLEKQQTSGSAPVAAAPRPAVAAAAPSAPSTATAKPAIPGEGEPVVGGSLPGSFKLPGTNTSVKLGGFAKLDAIYDANHAYGAQFANFAAIPLEGSTADRQSGEFNAHARNSRINLTTSTPTSVGDLKTFFEVDFFGSARGNANTTNGEGLQLRHAYGEVGGLLAGQTWSNFMDMDAYPESLDYIGPVGLSFVRQAQVRYSDAWNSNWSYALALEAPNTELPTTGGVDADLSQVPDITGRLVYKDDFGHLSLHGLARRLTATNTTTAAEDSTYGWGLGFSGRIKTFGKDNLAFQAIAGEGLGHYLLESAISGNGNTYVNNDLDAQMVYGGYLAYQHHWTDTWRSNLIFGYSGMDNDVALTGTNVNKEVASGHLNLIWSPVPQYRVGLEYMHGYRELESGRSGDLDRVQASFIYLF